jgi:hypothetical protein
VAGDALEVRQEARKLDGVAQTVVAADENMAISQRSAVPDPLLVTRQMPAGSARYSFGKDAVADVPGGQEIPAPHGFEPQ